MTVVNTRTAVAFALLLGAVSLTGCAQGGPNLPDEPKSVTSLPANTDDTDNPNAPDAALANDKETIASMARQGAMGQSVKDTLAGPGLLLSLGPVVSELRLGADGVLPDTTFTWAGCSDKCTPLNTKTVLMTLAADLGASGTILSRERITGAQASESDPRPEVLRDLPTVTAYREDATEQRWRSWHVSFDPATGGVLAIIGESGPIVG